MNVVVKSVFCADPSSRSIWELEYCKCEHKEPFKIDGMILISDPDEPGWKHKVICSECHKPVEAEVDPEKWKFVTGSLLKE